MMRERERMGLGSNMADCYVTVGTFTRLEQRSLVRLTKH